MGSGQYGAEWLLHRIGNDREGLSFFESPTDDLAIKVRQVINDSSDGGNTLVVEESSFAALFIASARPRWTGNCGRLNVFSLSSPLSQDVNRLVLGDPQQPRSFRPVGDVRVSRQGLREDDLANIRGQMSVSRQTTGDRFNSITVLLKQLSNRFRR